MRLAPLFSRSCIQPALEKDEQDFDVAPVAIVEEKVAQQWSKGSCRSAHRFVEIAGSVPPSLSFQIHTPIVQSHVSLQPSFNGHAIPITLTVPNSS